MRSYLSPQVTIDVKAPESGVLQMLSVMSGDIVKPGQTVAIVANSTLVTGA